MGDFVVIYPTSLVAYTAIIFLAGFGCAAILGFLRRKFKG